MLEDDAVFQAVDIKDVLCCLPGDGKDEWGYWRHLAFDFLTAFHPGLPAGLVLGYLVEAAYLPLNLG